MNPRDLAALILAVATLLSALGFGVASRDEAVAKQTTAYVDDSLRACLATLEHVMMETN